MAGTVEKHGEPIEVLGQISKSSGNTRVNLIQHQYTWRILNFSYSLDQMCYPLYSPVFSVGTENKTLWYLKVVPNVLSYTNTDSLGLYLCFLPGVVVSAKASCKLSIVNDKNINTNIFSFSNVCHFSERSSAWGWSNFVNRVFLHTPSNGCLSNDSLTIFCDLTVVESIANTAIEGASDDFILPVPRLLTDFVELYENPKLTDVTIVTRNKEFPAHKAILAARSPFFLTILENHEMMEEHNNRVYIMDVHDVVLQEVLRFIYTGVAFVDKMTDNLLAAADKYGLKRLKALCEKSLADNIAIENAADRLVIGELFDAGQLKKHALQFICDNATEVMKTESYKSLHHTHPNLIDQTLQAFAAATTIGLKTSGFTPKKIGWTTPEVGASSFF